MAKIRRGKITTGGGAPTVDVYNISWDDKVEFDRKNVDDQLAGKPVMMKKSSSGSFDIAAGLIASGYATASMVITYYEVSVAAGVETVANKTATFTDVTFNQGANIDNDAGPGTGKVTFEYGTCTLAAGT